MTIAEQLHEIVAEVISQHGIGYKISAEELKARVSNRFGTKLSSIIPSDYCYNRVNRGIDFINTPRLFRYIERGMYECLGEGHQCETPIFTRPQGTKSDIIVGTFKKGTLVQNHNWEKYGLK